MKSFFKLRGAFLIDGISENTSLGENSMDLIWSSPPYFNQEVYSNDENQAYNKTEDYFYNTYWRETLERCKKMLKPNKWFGLNVTRQYIKMFDIAKEYFKFDHEISLRLVRSHLNKKGKEDAQKYEPIFMFKA
jgi:tRNA1(Val) A37 N6-methylase TrmN6